MQVERSKVRLDAEDWNGLLGIDEAYDDEADISFAKGPCPGIS